MCGFGEYFYPGFQDSFAHKPRQIPFPEPMKLIACGQAHNLALSVSGNVYSWGSGEYGQLGHGVFG